MDVAPPFAGMTRSRFDGCDLSRAARHPGLASLPWVQMATETATWAELFEGEEVAYTRTEPPLAAGFAPIPGELDPRVRERLGHDALYAHQADAWEAARRGEHVIVTTGTASPVRVRS